MNQPATQSTPRHRPTRPFENAEPNESNTSRQPRESTASNEANNDSRKNYAYNINGPIVSDCDARFCACVDVCVTAFGTSVVRFGNGIVALLGYP